MRRIVFGLLAAAFLMSGQSLCGQNKSSAGLISILADPERFNGKQVTLFGFLLIEHQAKHAPTATLFLHEEDAMNLLPNGIVVVPSEQMLREREKIDRMYVILTGTVRVVPAANGPGDARVIVVKDIQSYRVWSNPQRPLLKKNADQGAGKQ